MQCWIDHTTNLPYWGDRAHPLDLAATSSPSTSSVLAELEEVETEAGELVWQHTGQWTPQISLEKAKAEVLTKIRGRADAIRKAITQGVSPAEAGAWPVKEQEALAVLANETADKYEMLAIEAEARQVSVEDIAERVINNANSWRKKEGAISGTRGYHADQVASKATVEEVLNYDWSTDWPESSE